MTRLANLSSMADDEVLELVWENGQILLRGRSTSPLCISYSSRSPKAQDKNDTDMYTTKRPRVGTAESVLGDSPLLGPPGPRELTNQDSSRQEGYKPKLLSRWHQTNFNVLKNSRNVTVDSHIAESQIVPSYKDENLRSANASKFVEEVPQLTTAWNGQLQQSSTRQRQTSIQLPRSIVNTGQTLGSKGSLPPSKFRQLDLGPNKNLGSQNFSLFLKSAALLRYNEQSSYAPRGPNSPRVEELKGNKEKPPERDSNPVQSVLMEPFTGSKCVKEIQDQLDPMATKTEPMLPIAKPPEVSPPDEQSEAVAHKDSLTSNKLCPNQVPGLNSSLAEKTVKGNHDAEKSIDRVTATASICSRGASNDPTYSLKRRCEDTEEMTCSISENVERGAKRRRTADVHNLSERKRRDKINKKIRALQNLIPKCNKVDKASVLDEAIEYLKTLQLQLQIMSMGTGLCVPPMMLPTGMQQIHAPHFAQFSPRRVGMDMRMHMNAGCSPTPFLTLPMLGPQGQVFPMPMAQPPFMPLIGDPSTHSVPVPGICGVTAAIGSSSLVGSMYTSRNINSE